jgi:predicted acyltransferase
VLRRLMPTPSTADAGATRLLSLDVFRGLSVAGMIVVNNPGSTERVWWPLSHAAWNGWTPADCVFPGFLFIVGVAIALALGRLRDDAAGRARAARRIRRRTLRLFALGLLLNAIPAFDLATLRVPGILQRIALCYGAASIAFLALDVAGLAALAGGLLVVYWALMTCVPVPGVGAGVLTPDDNLAAWLDRTLLPGHLLHDAWDPEGLLATLPAIATTLAGVIAGRWMRGVRDARRTCVGLGAAGAAGLLAGALLAAVVPVNKALWTPSFVVLTAATSALGLAACAWLADVRGWRAPLRPLVVFGRNPIALYLLATVAAKLLWIVPVVNPAGTITSLHKVLYRGLFGWAGNGSASSLLFALAFLVLWLPPMAALHRRGLFLRV